MCGSYVHANIPGTKTQVASSCAPFTPKATTRYSAAVQGNSGETSAKEDEAVMVLPIGWTIVLLGLLAMHWADGRLA
jgi:hypothetical protein